MPIPLDWIVNDRILVQVSQHEAPCDINLISHGYSETLPQLRPILPEESFNIPTSSSPRSTSNPLSSSHVTTVRGILHGAALHRVTSIIRDTFLLYRNNLLVLLDQGTPAAAEGLEAVGRAVTLDAILGARVAAAAEDEEAFEGEGHEEGVDGALGSIEVSKEASSANEDLGG